MDRLEKIIIIPAAIIAVLVFASPIIFLLVLLGCSYGSEIYHSHFGKVYPYNHVYRALLAANDKRLAANKRDSRKKDDFDDLTEEIRGILKGETFEQLNAEFNELGASIENKDIGNKFIAGNEYTFTLDWHDISPLKIPNSTFNLMYANPDTIRFSVTVRYNSDHDYQVINAKSEGSIDMFL